MTTPVAAPRALDSRIESVVVYRRGALVRRVARLELNAEEPPGRVRIAGLPLTLDDGSLRVTLASADGDDLGLIASAAHVTLEASAGQASPESLDAEWKAARREETYLRVELEEVERRITAIGQLTVAARAKPTKDEPPGASPMAARLAFIEWQARELETLHRRRATLLQQHEEAARKTRSIDVRRDRLSDAHPAREHELRKSVLIDLQRVGGAKAGAIEVHLEYLTPGASWAATYRIEFDRALQRASLAFRALIRQATGEDWQQVAVTLSTAEPNSWRELPELASKRIGRRQSRPPSGWRAPPSGASELFADYDLSVQRSSAAPASPAAPARRPLFVVAGPPGAAGGYAGAVLGRDATAELLVDDDLDDEGTHVGRLYLQYPPAGAPMQPVGAPPPPAMAPPAMAPPAMAPPAMAPPAQASRAAGGASSSFVEFSQSRDPEPRSLPRAKRRAPAPSDTVVLSREGLEASRPAGLPPALYDYGRLTLAGFNEAQRGELRFVSEIELFQRVSIELGWRETRALSLSRIAESQAVAREAESKSWLTGCQTWHDPAGYDYAYPTESRIDVPSDGQPHGVPVLARSGPARPRYVCVPRESPQVFRLGEFDNPLDAPLPPGPVDVVVAGEYLLTSHLSAVAAHAPARLGLGVEQGIKVARNTHFREESANFLGGSLDLIHEITVEVANRLDRAVHVEVRERVPTKAESDDSLTLTVPPADPPWKAYTPEDGSPLDGGYCWTIDVAPHATVKLKAGYTARIAAKNELFGGNRRES